MITDFEYLTYLQNLRNDFYNRNDYSNAKKVQSDINNLTK